MHVSRPLAIVGAAVVALTIAGPISATPPTAGTGTGTVGIRSVTLVRTADGNVIQERDLAGTVDGTLVGTYEEHVRGVIHSTGLVTFEGTMTFTGTVAGCGAGTFTLGVSGKGITGAPVTDSTVRVIDGAENTLGVHGVGTVNQVGPNLSYDIRYQC